MIVRVRHPDDAPYRSPQCIRTRLVGGSELVGLDGLQAFVGALEEREIGGVAP